MKVSESKHHKNDAVAAGAVGIWESEPFYERYNGELVRIARDVNAEFENHKKDLTTGLWMLSITKESCLAGNGFFCKVSVR